MSNRESRTKGARYDRNAQVAPPVCLAEVCFRAVRKRTEN